MSAPGPSAPSLVDLAHAAEQAIARYVAAVDGVCKVIGNGRAVSISGLFSVRSAAFVAVDRLWTSVLTVAPSEVAAPIYSIRGLLGAGIVRPEWGLRVVAIATAVQAGKAASDG